MTLSDWRVNVSSHLQFIEAGAEMAARHARSLPCRPEFQTKAQDALAEARRTLTAALMSLAEAEQVYADKPLEIA